MEALTTYLSYLFTFLIGFFAKPFQERFSKRVNAPKMSIKFDMNAPYFHKTIINASKKEDKGNYYGFFLRFGIFNESDSDTAKNCKVFLTGISHRDEAGNFINKPNFEPVKLKMSQYVPGFYYPEQDISPHQEIYGFLGRVAELEYQKKYDKNLSADNWEKPQFQISFDLQIPKWMQSHLDKGLNRLHVAIYFGNRPPIHKTFEVNWTGEWFDDFEKMKNAITAKLT